MPRIISFVVLLAIVALLGAIFFHVMGHFIVPLFLACVLLVIFQPLYQRILAVIPAHPRLAALATTLAILLAVLLPLTWLGLNAYRELHSLFHPADLMSASDVELESPGPDSAGPPIGAHEQQEFRAWLHEFAYNVRNSIAESTPLRIDDEIVDQFVRTVPALIGAWVISGVQSAIGVLIGLLIMIIAFYYFLADGPQMIRAAMYLSPLEDTHKQELLERFGDVSRAVVVATLLSAVVQGLLDGIGYFFALPRTAPIFLLTAVTMVASLVPFIGAAVVWVSVCTWIYLYGERVVDGQLVQGSPTTAIILALYCAMVVGVEHFVKWLVVRGQARLHPLLALLSILGGLEVLGPVGILVGPMVVSFLQALLYMLRRELDRFSRDDALAAQLAPNAPVGTAAVSPSSPAAEHKAGKSTIRDGIKSIGRRSKRKWRR